MRKNLWISLVIVLTLALSTLACICGGAATPEKVEPAPTLAPKVEATAAPPTPVPPPPTPVPPTLTPVPTVFRVGEAIKLKGTIVTVTGIDFSEGGEWDKPDAGKIYLLVHLHIENAGPDEIPVNPWDFKVKDSNGVIVDTAFATFVEDDLPGADLAPGGKIDGTVPFEVPRGDPSLELIYQPNIFIDAERVVIQLGASPQ